MLKQSARRAARQWRNVTDDGLHNLFMPRFIGQLNGTMADLIVCFEDAGLSTAGLPSCLEGPAWFIARTQPHGNIYAKWNRMQRQDLHSVSLFRGDQVEQFELWLCFDSMACLTEFEVIAAELTEALQAFSASELAAVRSLNPLCRRVTALCTSRRWHMRRTTVIIRDHPLLEKVNLVESLLSLGLDPGSCFFITKTDDCLYRRKVERHLRRLGITVLDGIDARSICAEWQHARQLVAIDDGGELLLRLCELMSAPINTRLVETTSNGIRRLNQAGIRSYVNLAHSSIKTELSQEIASSCVARLLTLLCHTKVSRIPCLVFGFGRIGRHIARIMHAHGSLVMVIDPDEEAVRSAREEGFTSVFCVQELCVAEEVMIVIGCSGELSIGPEVLPLASRRLIVSSVSSRDAQPLISYLKAHDDCTFVTGWGLKTYFRTLQIDVLGAGSAINLFQWEGVSEMDFDAFTALQLLSAAWCGGQMPLPVPEASELCNEVNRLAQ